MDAYTWLRIGALALLVLFTAGFLRGQSRWRRFSVTAEIVRCFVAVVVLAAIVWIGRVSMNPMWAAVTALGGLALGYLSGRGSKLQIRQGSKTLKTALWPAFVVAVGYLLVITSAMFGTAVIVSASLLVPLLGTAMTLGAAGSEVLRARATVGTTV